MSLENNNSARKLQSPSIRRGDETKKAKKPRKNPRNRSRKEGNRPPYHKQAGRKKRRVTKKVPLSFWDKILKLFGLYKEPSRPPRRRPAKNLKGREPQTYRSPRQIRTKPEDIKTTRIYLGNLSYGATEEDLKDLFKGVGPVKDVEIIYNRHTHRSRGYGFIEMLNIDDAKRAVEVLHDQPFMGRNLIVSDAKRKKSSNEDDDS